MMKSYIKAILPISLKNILTNDAIQRDSLNGIAKKFFRK